MDVTGRKPNTRHVTLAGSADNAHSIKPQDLELSIGLR